MYSLPTKYCSHNLQPLPIYQPMTISRKQSNKKSFEHKIQSFGKMLGCFSAKT